MEGKNTEQLGKKNSEKKEISKRNRIAIIFFQKYFYYLIATQILAIFLLGYLFLIKPQTDLLFNSQKQRALAEEQTRESILSYDQQIKELQAIVDAYNGVGDSNVEAINTMLPDKESMEDLFNQINEIVKFNGLLLTGISVNNEDGDENLQKQSRINILEKAPESAVEKTLKQVVLDLKITGAGYKSFKNFLASLESNLRIIDVQNIKYNPRGEVAELSIVAYYFEPSDISD